MNLTRRGFLNVAGGSVFSSSLAGMFPTAAAKTSETWMALLGASLAEEKTYRPRTSGVIPADLRGTLYRNGPGLFERDGLRKRHLLDGDGLIQAFSFDDSGVSYRTRFVRTEKFLAESKAGKYLHPTWSTRAPGGPLKNLGGPILSQAGVTVVEKNGALLAFDEVNPAYQLDPQSLETIGPHSFGSYDFGVNWKAHTKTDGKTGEWVLFGQDYGRTNLLGFCVFDAAGKKLSYRTLEVPKPLYIHDFFVTRNHVVFLLHPVVVSPFPFLLGMRSFIDSLSWEPDLGNIVMVAEKHADNPPLILETEPAFMWHSLNAFEEDGVIVADFVGYDAPDHFIGEQALLATLMQGHEGEASSPGTMRRYRIDLNQARLSEEPVNDASFEFPMTDPRVQGQPYEVGYFTHAASGQWQQNAIARMVMATGEIETFPMGERSYAGEPVFAPRPGGRIDDGWLLTEVLDGDSGLSRLEIFDARRVSNGPVATVELEHHVPISFHGWWS